MRKLDCLIISTARAASTSVYYYLNEIGELGLPGNKEPHFWCDLKKFDGRYSLLDKLHVGDPIEYECLYSNSKKMIDASVGYFFCMDEVVSRLNAVGQKPKILFLYRDPVSRAASLFNELRKKGIETSPNVGTAIRLAMERTPGLWWERYYDNVLYNKVFNFAVSNSESVLAVNYHAFSKSTEQSMERIMDFLGILPVRTIDYRPMNTSSEALATHRTRHLRWIAPIIPLGVKNFLRNRVFVGGSSCRMPRESLATLLPNSIAEYAAFQKAVKEQDFYDSRN